jgi:hypothetical protein
VNLWDSGKFLVNRHYYPPFGCAAVRSDDMMIHQSGGFWPKNRPAAFSMLF